MAVRIVGDQSELSGDPLQGMGPAMLDYLRTRLDLSMVADAPGVSRYAVSSVDAGNVPSLTGSSSISGGGGGTGVTSVFGRSGSVIALTGDYAAFYLGLTATAVAAVKLATARTINGVAFDGTANIIVAAAAGTLTGATLAANVLNSSLTSVGTLTALTVTATITGSVSGNAATVTTNADLTGPVTSVGNATAVTANAITNAMLAQMATLTLKGNNTGATGNALDLTVAQVNAILPVFTSTLNGLAPLSGGGTTNFLRADGTWAAPVAGSGTVTSVSVVSANGFAGTVATPSTTPAITIETSITGILYGNGTAVAAAIAADFPVLNQSTTGNAATVTTNADLTGPVTSVGNATAVTANAITNAMLAQMATLTLKGNNTGATGNALDLTVAQVNAILPVFTSTLNGLAPLSGGGTTNFLRADGTWAAPVAGSGTVTSVSVVSANGFAGTVATPSTTPAITIETSITGILYGNGTAVAAAIAADFPVLNQSTTGNAATVTTNADLTGPVTSVGNATAVTANAITNAMLAQMATLTLKGNNTGATGNALDLTVAQVNAILPVFTSTLNGLAPLSGGGTTNFLRADGTWAAPVAGSGTVTSVSVVSANGFAGTVATPSTTPAITIETSITGILYGNGTAVAAAIAADFPVLNQSTTGNAATVTTNADLTGPVTSVGNATAVTANAITNAMLAQMATLTLKGNNTGATGNALDLTVAQVNAILPVFTSTLNGLAPLSGGGTTNFLRADGTWAAPVAGSGTVTSVSVVSANGFAGTVATPSTTPAITIETSITGILYGNGTAVAAAIAADFPVLNQSTTGNAATVTTNADLTGPVTSVGNATAVTANAITNAMLAQMATLTLKGNNTGATGNALDLTVAQVNAILPVFTSTLNGLAPLSGGGTTNFLRADGTWNEPPGTPDSVSSVFGRTGAVVALLGDYTLTDVTDALTLLPIGTGDGTTTAFNLPTGWLAGSSIYKSDWQGNQLQYSTPRTNLLLYSNSMGGTDWTLNNATVTLNDITAPDGTITATLVTDTATTANHGVSSSISSSTTQILFSCFVKAGSLQYASLQFLLDAGGIYCYYTLTGAGSVSQAPLAYGGALLTGAYGEITALSGGWYKISLFANIVSGNANVGFNPQMQNAATGPGYYTGTGTDTIYMWGAQLEISAVPTSHIPTTSSPVTVTDYSLNSTQITFSTAPLNLAVLTAETGRAAVINGPDLWGVLQVDLYGRALIDFSQTTHLNKNLDNIPDGATRFAVPAITGILYGTGSGVAAAIAADFPTLNQSTTGNAATVTTNADLTGPVTSVGNATAVTANAITNAMLAQMATLTLKGNNTGATGNALDLTAAQVNAILPVFTSTLNGLAPLSGGGTTNFLRADGTWAAPVAGSGTVTSVSVVSANGFAGTVATPSTTPAITIETSITGILYGNGTAVAAAVAADFPTLNQSTTGNAGSATKLQTARTIDGVSFNGTANISIPLDDVPDGPTNYVRRTQQSGNSINVDVPDALFQLGTGSTAPPGWTVITSNGTLSYPTTAPVPLYGFQYLEITATAVAPTVLETVASWKAKPGDVVTLGGAAGILTAGNAVIGIEWYEGTGTAISESIIGNTGALAAITPASFVAPALTAYFKLRISQSSVVAIGDKALFNEVACSINDVRANSFGNIAPATTALVSATTYQNTTGGPIVLYIPISYTNTITTGTVQVFLGPSSTPGQIFENESSLAATATIETITLMVPNNWYYKLLINAAATIGTVYMVQGI